MKKNILFTKLKKTKKKNNNWLYKIKNIFLGDTVYRKFFRIYFLTIFLGSCLLYMPFSLNPGWTYENNQYVWYQNGQVFQTYSFFDSIFFASSAFSDTGLVTKTTSYIFSISGQFIILVLIQTGGLGLLVLIVLLWRLFTGGKRITIEQRTLIHTERGNTNVGETYKMIYFAFAVIIIVEILIWICLSFFFYHVKPSIPLNQNKIITPQFEHLDANKYYQNAGLSIWAGFFLAISSINNAGFDILGTNSIEPFHNGMGNILSVTLLVGLIFGGIGYPIFYDLFQWIKAKRKKLVYNLTLFTKIALLAYLIIALFGVFLILVFELTNHTKELIFYNTTNLDLNVTTPVYGWGNASSANKIWNFIFLSFSARSAGFSSFPITDLSIQSRWLITTLMFIGASPSSTGGGVRTITLFLIFLFIYTRALGRKYVCIFKKSIHKNIINESLIIFILAFFLVFSIMFVVSFSGNFRWTNLAFEVISAFGTSGLTTTITQKSNYAGLIGLIALMFIGQLGVGSTLLTWKKKNPHKEMLRYQYEDLRVN